MPTIDLSNGMIKRQMLTYILKLLSILIGVELQCTACEGLLFKCRYKSQSLPALRNLKTANIVGKEIAP